MTIQPSPHLPLTSHPRATRPCATAFSLAETLFAMAIVSFALLSIIGLLPTALSELNDAERRTAEARILQSLTADFELKPWAEVRNLASRETYYFDIRGVRLRNLTVDTHYAAQVSPMPADSNSGNTDQAGELSLPGEGSAGDYLRRLRVSITDRPRDPMAFTADEKRKLRRDHALILANREPDLLP